MRNGCAWIASPLRAPGWLSGGAVQLVTFERRSGSAAQERADPSAHPHAQVDTPAPGVELDDGGTRGTRRVGALLVTGPRAGDVVDLHRALSLLLALDDVGAPEAQAESLLPPDPLAFLRRIDASLPAARRALAFVQSAQGRFDAPDFERAGVLFPRRRVRLAAPVPRPGKIVAVARNYAAHAEERGGRAAAPEEPVLFLKAPSSVIGPEDEIVLPRASREVDYEGELAVVIGHSTRGVSEEDALACVAGYTVANDVSARDYQNVRGQHFIGKSCDTFAPLGPALVTADEVPDPQDLALRTVLSGEVVQSARTKEMTFSVAALIAFASKLMTLEPGDVLLTGTPGGVGAARTPPRWLREGDVVEVEIERIGKLHSYVTRQRE
jgi:acylpyruvate hydrolase